MILRKLLNSQKLRLIKEFVKEHPEIWDIAIYGSYVRGKEDSRDLDFAIILSRVMEAGKKLDLAYECRKYIEKILPLHIDVQVVDIKDFFDVGFMARQGIIAEGYLILMNKSLAESLGFETFVFVKYNFTGLTYSQKKMFYYALRGRRGKEGVLDDINGLLLSKCILKVPIENAHKIEELLRLHKVSYSLEYVMSYMKKYQG